MAKFFTVLQFHGASPGFFTAVPTGRIQPHEELPAQAVDHICSLVYGEFPRFDGINLW